MLLRALDMTHWNHTQQVHRICNQQLTRNRIYCNLWDYRRLTSSSHTAGLISIQYASLTEIKAIYYSRCLYLYRLSDKQREGTFSKTLLLLFLSALFDLCGMLFHGFGLSLFSIFFKGFLQWKTNKLAIHHCSQNDW